jgi:diguanylate cyclase
MLGEGKFNPESQYNGQAEESEAEKVRRAYVSEMFQGATEQLMNETHHERRKNETLEKELAETQIKAEHDPLTGLLNIDFYKKINDDFGHNVGDDALKIAATYLKENSRPTDLVVRLGGEEMAIFLPGATSQDVINKFPGRGRGEGKIEVPVDFKGEKRDLKVITFSGGVTELSAYEEIKDAIERADKALYEAKENGRNHILVAPNSSE